MAPTHLYTCQSEASGPHFSLFPSSETPTDQSNMLALLQLAAGPRDIADSPPPPHSNLTFHLHHTLSRHRETRSSPVGGALFLQLPEPPASSALCPCPLPPAVQVPDPCASISSPPACQKPRPVPVPVHSLTCNRRFHLIWLFPTAVKDKLAFPSTKARRGESPPTPRSPSFSSYCPPLVPFDRQTFLRTRPLQCVPSLALAPRPTAVCLPPLSLSQRRNHPHASGSPLSHPLGGAGIPRCCSISLSTHAVFPRRLRPYQRPAFCRSCHLLPPLCLTLLPWVLVRFLQARRLFSVRPLQAARFLRPDFRRRDMPIICMLLTPNSVRPVGPALLSWTHRSSQLKGIAS